jgi:hypothetical protein
MVQMRGQKERRGKKLSVREEDKKETEKNKKVGVVGKLSERCCDNGGLKKEERTEQKRKKRSEETVGSCTD